MLYIAIFAKEGSMRNYFGNDSFFSLQNKNETTLRSTLTYGRIHLTHWYDIAQMALLVIVIGLLPSVSSTELMQGTTSGKMFFFLYVILVYAILYSLKFITKLPSSISFSYMDGLLLVWTAYIFINGWFHHIHISDRLLEFGGLMLLYIFLRQIGSSKYGIVLVAMVLGGSVQAVYGNLQLWGYMPSHHALFKMTGSFFNPGPFAGYLASVFPVIIGAILFKKKYVPFITEKVSRGIAWGGIALVLLALSASGSRAACLSIAVSSLLLFIKRYSIAQWIKNCTVIKRIVLFVSVLLFAIVCFIGLVKINTDSTSGRLLVWKVASGMVAEHPFAGVGYDRFKAYYMDKQADYFKENPDSSEAMAAGDTVYCFNEFLQHAVETGGIGLIFMLGGLIYIFSLSNKFLSDELWIAKAGIAGIVVFAMFSYPAQILPIKISLVCYLAYIAILTDNKKMVSLQKGKYFYKVVFVALAISAVFIVSKSLPAYYTAWKGWSVAYQSSQMNDYPASVKEDVKAWPLLRYNGDFLTHYGKMLNKVGEYRQSIDVLHEAALYSPNTIIYITLGDNYKALKRFDEAEHAYLKAWYMNPSRFYPKYLLAKMYDETGQVTKAKTIAKELLEKKVKVESTAIDEIQTEMKNILERNNERR